MKTTPLEEHLGYIFNDPSLLVTALRHSSFVNEQSNDSMADNERLEFLGDAALNLCISHLLYSTLPGLNEGALSQIRANLVNDDWLAEIARTINLGDHLQLGRGEEHSQGREKNSILAGAFEAIMGALFLDGQLPIVFQTVEKFFAGKIKAHLTAHIIQDYKSTLQELLQLTEKTEPRYQITKETGPAHKKTFHCRVIAGQIQAEGAGKSKKSAQQEAARNALNILQEGDDNASST